MPCTIWRIKRTGVIVDPMLLIVCLLHSFGILWFFIGVDDFIAQNRPSAVDFNDISLDANNWHHKTHQMHDVEEPIRYLLRHQDRGVTAIWPPA